MSLPSDVIQLLVAGNKIAAVRELVYQGSTPEEAHKMIDLWQLERGSTNTKTRLDKGG